MLAGMRPSEEEPTRLLMSTLHWHPVDADIAEEAGALGRRWLPKSRHDRRRRSRHRGDSNLDALPPPHS